MHGQLLVHKLGLLGEFYPTLDSSLNSGVMTSLWFSITRVICCSQSGCTRASGIFRQQSTWSSCLNSKRWRHDDLVVTLVQTVLDNLTCTCSRLTVTGPGRLLVFVDSVHSGAGAGGEGMSGGSGSTLLFSCNHLPPCIFSADPFSGTSSHART